jgi:hypothetical protein
MSTCVRNQLRKTQNMGEDEKLGPMQPLPARSDDGPTHSSLASVVSIDDIATRVRADGTAGRHRGRRGRDTTQTQTST